MSMVSTCYGLRCTAFLSFFLLCDVYRQIRCLHVTCIFLLCFVAVAVTVFLFKH